jgi:3-hydroxy acid dehydrogenase/malonic semialdehyde reductase
MTVVRTFVVTGASSGIGREVCKTLLEGGYGVIGIARDPDKAAIENPNFKPWKLDLSKLDTLPTHLNAIACKYPEVKGVIGCAAQGRFGSLEEFAYHHIRQLIDLNLTSQLYVARAFLPAMKRQREGNLIFIGSEAGLVGGQRGAVYSATKFALRGLAQSLRQECARNGVRICIINPGMVRTDFYADLWFGPGEREENYILPQDIAEAVRFVISLRPGTVVDEINLSPQKKVISKKKSEK